MLFEESEGIILVEGDAGTEDIYERKPVVFHTPVQQFGEMLRVAAKPSGDEGGT